MARGDLVLLSNDVIRLRRDMKKAQRDLREMEMELKIELVESGAIDFLTVNYAKIHNTYCRKNA